jgi:predicted transcriptional regulator
LKASYFSIYACERLFMTLAEIAETLGLPARTIQFYIARGLLTQWVSHWFDQ